MMDNDDKRPVQTQPQEPPPIDPSRRRVTRAGLAGTGVIASLTARTALGGWGTCTRSEMLSGNLSRQGDYNPCGCSPGYWRNHQSEWRLFISDGLISGAYSPDANFDTVFGLTGLNGMKGMFNPDGTLLQIADKQLTPLNCGKAKNFIGTAQNAAFHAVAALLNASVYGMRYPSIYNSPSAVINAFHAAATSSYGACNKDSFTSFIAAVDIYDSRRTWCFGSPH